MNAEILWVLASGVLIALMTFSAYLRESLRQLSRVAARGIFKESNGTEPAGKIPLHRERATVAVTVFHAAVVGLLGVALAAFRFSAGRSMSGAALEALLGLSLSLAVFDQLIPSLWLDRRKDPEATLRRWAQAVMLFYWCTLPLTFLGLIFSSLRSLLKSEEQELEADQQQEAIQDLIEAGQEEGLIEPSEGEMIQSVVEFGDTTVREVMTPRHEIVALDFRASLQEMRRVFRQNKHRRIVVYAKDLDQILGVANVGDLLEMTPEEERQATLESLISPVRYVPETKKVSELLKELQQETLQMAVVIDEYGAVAGLATLEDLVEEIVGEIRDELEPHKDDIRQESEDSFLVAGHTEVSQLADRFHAQVEGRDYNTVSGLIIAKLGRVPPPGERVEKGGLSFEVLASNTRTVLQVRVAASPPAVSSFPDSHAS